MAHGAGDSIYFLTASGGIEEVARKDYESEAFLQRLIASHPQLLAGLEWDDEPVRWLLVSREVGIPGESDTGNRWAVDHLLLDQHGVPTFVEVKRSSDTRIRREVVGRMLDYAANARAHWPLDRIRTAAAQNHSGTANTEEAIVELLGQGSIDDPGESVEAFWATVEKNLRTGRLRLLFVPTSYLLSYAGSSSF